MKTAQLIRVCGEVDWSKLPRIEIDAPIKESDSPATAYAQICATEEALLLHLSATEPEIRAELTDPLAEVCEDSCLEFFFAPVESDDRYMNVEFSSTGCLFLGIGTNRYNIVRLLPQGNPFQAAPALTADGWEIVYQIPTAFIRQFFPAFTMESGKIIRANFYKCGDLTVQEHYFSWNPVTSVNPDFHRSCDFGQLILA